jgi:hypothetical protein
LIALDCSLLLLVARFRDLGVKSKLICLMSQSVMMCLFEGVLNLKKMSTWFRKSPRPMPLSHWTRLLILDAGTLKVDLDSSTFYSLQARMTAAWVSL